MKKLEPWQLLLCIAGLYWLWRWDCRNSYEAGLKDGKADAASLPKLMRQVKEYGDKQRSDAGIVTDKVLHKQLSTERRLS